MYTYTQCTYTVYIIETHIMMIFPPSFNTSFVPLPGIRIAIRGTTDFCVRPPRIYVLV